MLHDSILQSKKEPPKVSVIIPLYNTEEYIADCLQSVLDQTYQNFEIICVDDGSTDSGADIVKGFADKDKRIRFIQIENHGQGYVRNMALEKADGEYIQFLDADDHLDALTLELAVTKAVEDKSDLVIYDWFYYNPESKKPNYCNKDTLFADTLLTGEACLSLLEISPIFTVNKLYSREFLRSNDIRYGEGYVYEDNPFWIKVAINAKRVSTLHSPLYRVTINKNSTTKTDLQTSKHCDGFVRAVNESLKSINEKENAVTERAKFAAANYFIQKFTYYYEARTPKNLKSSFLKRFVEEMSQLEFSDFGKDKLVSASISKGVFTKKNHAEFKRLFFYYRKLRPTVKNALLKIERKLKKLKSSAKEFIKVKILKRRTLALTMKKYRAELLEPIYDDSVLFMGFDHRYTGNSRYLFEEILRCDTKKKIYFVSTSDKIPEKYRVTPESDEAYRLIARSKVIIFESWIPPKYVKREGVTWIQLWHGTPIKKLMFDSNEKSIILKNPSQKNAKHKDILRWDKIITDNPTVAAYFRTCFLLDEEKMLNAGYPRVKYLLDNKNNSRLVDSIKDNLGIPKDKKTVLYLPTWRDYNYRATAENFDTSYILNLKKLSELLGDGYEIIYKDHAFASNSAKVNFKNYDKAETQELLLIADALVTDYSSVIFDAIAASVPSLIYCNDFERNEELRGVYKSIWQDISPLSRNTVEEIAEAIKNYPLASTCDDIRKKYCYKNAENVSLCEYILNL